MSEEEVRVGLPRSTLAGATVEPNGPLRKLGMVEAFDKKKADSSGMAHIENPIRIDEVFHKAFVEVNEQGSEVAPATAVIAKTVEGHIEPSFSFTADHPFLFLIRDDRTGCILFLGRPVDPKG